MGDTTCTQRTLGHGGYGIELLIRCAEGVQRKEGSHLAGALRGDFMELVAELGLEGWT